MKLLNHFGTACAAAIVVYSVQAKAQQPPPQSPNMTFFVTSVGPGKGADLGGLEGADRYCQTLAQGAGAGGKTWRAYLSTQAEGGTQAINARDRIGNGPWQNFKGEVIAQNADDLHGDNNLPLVRTEPAATGQAARKVRQWSVTSIARGYGMMQHPARGTPHIRRVEQMEGAAKPISAAPAATVYSTASLLNRLVPARIRRPRPYDGVAGSRGCCPSCLT
jgi:hypothetical protein